MLENILEFWDIGVICTIASKINNTPKGVRKTADNCSTL